MCHSATTASARCASRVAAHIGTSKQCCAYLCPSMRFRYFVTLALPCCCLLLQPNQACSPLEDQLAEVGRAVQQGKVRHVGLSNETPWGVMKALQAGGWLTGSSKRQIQQTKYEHYHQQSSSRSRGKVAGMV